MLHVHRASRADALVSALGRLLREPAADPFMPEVVAVPTRGMERWLAQRMSHVLGAGAGREDGVCANVLFPKPRELLGAAVAVAAGVDPEADSWLPERMLWPLLEVVDRSLSEPWLGALAAYLGVRDQDADRSRRARRLTTVARLAALLDRYALHRPAMLDAWRAGRDEDDSGAALAPTFAWQAELWRRLRARIAEPDVAQRTAAACERLRQDPQLVDLPPRLALFGLTRLAAGDLQVLDALAAGRDVHLFLAHPSPQLWQTLRFATAPPRLARSEDETAQLPANRLLASWGRDAREMQLVLSACAPAADHPYDPQPGDEPATARTLLEAVQEGVRADRPAPGPPLAGRSDARIELADHDRSIEIHACHGRARQVEVLREAVLDALAADPTLEPRDVIVMCPDIETFAPLIQATFGRDESAAESDEAAGAHAGDATELRVRLADRSSRRTNPILDVVARLLELAERRLTASEVLDLAGRVAVRRRFRFDDDELSRLQEWVAEAGIRWGLDAAHRAPFALQRLGSGTWSAGLDRLLLGVAMSEDGERRYGGVLPLDGVDGASIDLAGRFAELIARLGEAVRALGATQSPAGWAEAIAQAADSLTAAGPRESWQRAELDRVLEELLAGAGEDPQLWPAEVRAHLAQRLAGRPTRGNFRTGHLTICTLEPMRSVPHRLVCLLGLDDGAFPRKAPRDGDDLMLLAPRVGERDARSEDRQLLLDALLAAGERLIITYAGGDERTGAELPPAVPVGELLDAIDATARTGDGPARRRIVVRHPLQPFHPRNFTPGAIAGDRPWSFDHSWLAGAAALRGPRLEAPPFLSSPLAPRGPKTVELEDLVRFLERPVRAFLRQRLDVVLRQEDDDEIEDSLTLELTGLERWGIGDRMLRARLRGVGEREAILAEIARGTLPPGALGQPVVKDLSPIVTAILKAAAARMPEGASLDPAASDPIDVRVVVGDRVLSGTVAGVVGDVLLATTFSRVSARQRLGAWARLLAATAAAPERPFSAVTVGRAGGIDDVRIAEIGPLGETAVQRRRVAIAQLQLLLDLYDRGMREPLPIASRSSLAYAEAALAGRDAAAAAAAEWQSAWRHRGEDAEPEHVLVLGRALPFATLTATGPRSDEDGDGWASAEPSRFGRLALRLWAPLLA
ncbi:MAG: exodeoxyribonuclease V subunit gamma, partial [Solirubrobacteraceae bacterium]